MAIKNKTKSPIYWIWNSMKARCFKNYSKSYMDYGERGITISDEWLDFRNFEKDMASSYKKGLTLERIDNDGDYCKENCRWATRLEQCNNKRNNRFVEYNGESMTLPQWARKFGIKDSTVRQRFYVYKWPIEKCLTYNRRMTWQ